MNKRKFDILQSNFNNLLNSFDYSKSKLYHNIVTI